MDSESLLSESFRYHPGIKEKLNKRLIWGSRGG